MQEKINGSPRISVAFFLPSFEIGGAERNTQKLLSFLNRDIFSPSLVLARKTGDLLGQVPKDVPVVDLRALGYLGTLLELRRYLLEKQPDVLVSAFPHFNVICLLARQLAGVKTKIVITEHTPFSLLSTTARNFFNKFVTLFFLPLAMKIYYPKADAVVCVSRGVARDLASLVTVKNVNVIYNPIVDGELERLSHEHASHAWFNDSTTPVIIAVGRLAKAKDYPTLFGAMKLMVKQRSVRLIILGDGPEKSHLTTMVTKMGLSDVVDFLGFCDNPYAYMKQASLYVLSSMQEGFGNTIVEAMACALPVVATDCPSGPREIIENGKNGILVPVANPLALFEAMVELLDNHALRQACIKEGVVRAQDFSVSKSVGHYEAVFREVIR
ncbi:MAG: glycosyltransferase [Candidatus Staskawiczbacteria bacterium]|nr:glycosyltransferase [Candidatus Staskawiczbacteria bacterium]